MTDAELEDEDEAKSQGSRKQPKEKGAFVVADDG